MGKRLAPLVILAVLVSVIILTGCNTNGSEKVSSITLITSKDGIENCCKESVCEGLNRLKDDYEISFTVVECEMPDLSNAIDNACKESDVVIVAGFKSLYIADTLDNYRKIKFVFVDSTVNNVSDFSNVLCITYAERESAFLAGYLAANITEDLVVGVDSTLNSDICHGFENGVKFANNGVRVIPGKNKSVFFVSPGVLELDGKVVCSVKADIGQSLYDIITMLIKDGIWSGGEIWEADMSSGYLALEYNSDLAKELIPETLQEEIERISSQIISGEIKVETT